MAWIPETFTVLLAAGTVVLIASTPLLREFVTTIYERYLIPGSIEPDELEVDLESTRRGERSDCTNELTSIVCWSCSTGNDPDFHFCRQCGERLMRPVG